MKRERFPRIECFEPKVLILHILNEQGFMFEIADRTAFDVGKNTSNPRNSHHSSHYSAGRQRS